MLHKATIAILFIFLFLFLIGCSSENNSPVTPTQTPETGNINESFPVVESSFAESSFNAIGVLGAYDIIVNADNLSFEFITKRASALGQSWIVSGIGFFTIAPCSDCLKIKSIELIGMRDIGLTFEIRHPFAPGNTSLPPSAVNRLDLDIFDTALVIQPDSTDDSFPLIGTSVKSGFVRNSDGYTKELSGMLQQNSALPYVLVVDDSESGGSTYNEFAMGASTTVTPVLHIAGGGGGSVMFSMYLTMGYGSSAQGKNQRLTPTYFNPEFNRKAAWKVNVIPPERSDPPAIGNTWQDNDSTTPYEVTVEVFDWQHGNTSIANPPVNPTDIAFASNVSMVSVEIPGMTNTLQSSTTPTGGTGAPDDPLVYSMHIANENSLPAGEYISLVKVADERVPGMIPPDGAIDFLIDSPNGIVLNNYAIPEFATYQTFIATVVFGCGPISGSITAPSCPITNVRHQQYLNFSATASSANGGDPITLYEWCGDYDGNPAHFTVDATGQNVSLQFLNNSCGTPNEQPVTYTVAVRATDSCNPPNVTVFATCEVTVNICLDPLKNIPLINGFDVYDLAVNQLNGDLIILYNNGDVYKYQRSNDYQSPTPSSIFYDTQWESYSGITFVRGYVDFAGDGTFGVVFASNTSGSIYRNMVDIVDSSGTRIRRNNPRGNWSQTYPAMEIVAWDNSGSYANYIGDVWYTSSPNYCYVSAYYPTAYSTERYAYHSRTTDYGYNAIHCGWVRGLEVDDNNNSFWAAEINDYYAARWRVSSWALNGFVYDNSYFGTGAQEASNIGFYTPRDLTRTHDNIMLVLDELSGPAFRVKAFDVTTSPGTSVAGFDLTGITGNAKRIDCGEWIDPTFGNALFVLQYDAATTRGYLSIYKESELPW